MSFQRIIQQPFWLATLGLAIAGWILAIVGIAVTQSEAFAYWSAVFLLGLIVAHAYCVITAYLFRARLALLAFNGVGIVYGTRYGDAGIFSTSTSDQVAGAGFIVLSTMLCLWVLAIGIEGSPYVAPMRRTASNGQRAKEMSSRSSLGEPAPTRLAASTAPVRSQLSSSSVGSSPAVTAGGLATGAAATSGGPVTVVVDQRNIPAADASGGLQVAVGDDIQYKHKGVAMYAYAGSADDPNELSFTKGDLLDIVDTQGKWWQAKKADGSIGIVPSNYIKLQQQQPSTQASDK